MFHKNISVVSRRIRKLYRKNTNFNEPNNDNHNRFDIRSCNYSYLSSYIQFVRDN